MLEENGFEQRKVILLGIFEVVNKLLRLRFLFSFGLFLLLGPFAVVFAATTIW